eukprot:TRINITY_DN66936_c8_g6_i2.p3 TRINITY_DN66936_c8_g6~~TRINITY_DN66936_c8_g6_i2.p3  ORF type:complete len:159 (-),score=62.53 TRINITY_DN66936_c8_g6_i2:658-1134(-)
MLVKNGVKTVLLAVAVVALVFVSSVRSIDPPFRLGLFQSRKMGNSNQKATADDGMVTVTLVLKGTDRTHEFKIDDLDSGTSAEREARSAFGLTNVHAEVEATGQLIVDEKRLLQQIGDHRRIVVSESVVNELSGAAGQEAKAVAAGKLGRRRRDSDDD